VPHRPLNERLTVVLLTYNCARWIEPVLAHLRKLDVPIVAVDNASTDGTAEVVAAAGVRLIRMPHNVGAAARNAGVRAVQTPYVAFCDDDDWYEPDGLPMACDLLDRHPRLALVNARIVVGPERHLDPISAEMADSPIVETAGIPGTVLMSFMAGACVVRVSAYREAGGYDRRFFLGGEEETLSYTLLKRGWQLRYLPELVVAHYPSLANFTTLRAYGMRNTLWTAWLHRRFLNALRYTGFVLADAPKNGAYARAIAMTLRGLPWVLRERQPMNRELDRDLRLLDARRFSTRRSLFTFRDRGATRPASWQQGGGGAPVGGPG